MLSKYQVFITSLAAREKVPYFDDLTGIIMQEEDDEVEDFEDIDVVVEETIVSKRPSRRFGSISGFIIRTMSNVERVRIIDKYWNWVEEKSLMSASKARVC